MIEHDPIIAANVRHWGELVREGQEFTVPWLDLDAESVRRFAAREIGEVTGPLFQMWPPRILRDSAGKDVLCLASGGGQQSAVFGLIGARVTVADLTPEQLEGDRSAAAHHGYEVTTVVADMRDLSALADDSFDLVWQAPSLGWVPDCGSVFREVARVLRPDGVYRTHVSNPANSALEWDGEVLKVTQPYSVTKIPEGGGAFTFRHRMGELFNGLIGSGLAIEEVHDHPWDVPDPDAEPGSWAHLMAHIVSIIIVARLRP